MADEPYNASEPDQVNARQKKADRQAKRLKGFVKAVMGMAEGRQWVWSTLDRCGVYRNPFSDSPYVTAFNAGQMNIGQAILAEVMAECPDLYLTMVKEQENG
jgi:hypothetical protein